MGKKIVTIDGKTYLADSESKEMEEVEVEQKQEDEQVDDEEKREDEEKEEEEKEEENKDEEDEEEEDDTKEKIQKAADKVIANLGLDTIQKKLNKIENRLENKADKTKKVSELLNLEELVGKSKDEMTTKEKVLGFFQAMVNQDHTALKALSEGTAADGGYLFPDEFRAEVIRDIIEGPFMRNHVTVIPMKRDIMKIPTLESRPKVTWTFLKSLMPAMAYSKIGEFRGNPLLRTTLSQAFV